MTVRVRALEASDAARAEALVRAGLAGTRYEMRALEIIASALTSPPDEFRGIVALTRDGSVSGVLVYGPLAGADTMEKLHILAGADDTLDALIASLVAARRGKARMIVCELPADLPFEPARRALERAAFRCEGSVEGLFTPSIGLKVYVLRY